MIENLNWNGVYYRLCGVVEYVIILKPILSLEQSCNIYNRTVICGLICWGKQWLQQFFTFQQKRVCIRKIGKCK